MARELMTDADVRGLLERAIRLYGSRVEAARRLGISTVYLWQLLQGKRSPGPAILASLGLEVRYVRGDTEKKVVRGA